jgi:hypothetical protein
MNKGAQVIFALMKKLLTPIGELLHIILSIFQAIYISNVELFELKYVSNNFVLTKVFYNTDEMSNMQTFT